MITKSFQSHSTTMPAVTGPEPSRRHDLDALRAAAMLLGIVYHASLSFALGLGWMVQDVSQSRLCYIFQAFVHGFRMQLFFVISGFFTAMLWRNKGLKSLLWHRFRRVLLPCLVGLVTVVPAMSWATNFGIRSGAQQRQAQVESVPARSNIWAAIRLGDLPAMNEQLQQPGVRDALHPEYGITPLTWAALVGRQEMVARLLEQGADVKAVNRDGGTALHSAAFLGRTEIVEQLLAKGAQPLAVNFAGETPFKSASGDIAWVDYIGGALGIKTDRAEVEAGRKKVLELLAPVQAIESGAPAPAGTVPPPPVPTLDLTAIYRALVSIPVFVLIWFLWFLVWLVALFIGYTRVAAWVGWTPSSLRFLLLPGRCAWLIPLTALPQWFMGSGHGEFGPDTSMGLLPMPHVLAYYAIFFFVGALYFDAGDVEGEWGGSWRWLLPFTLLMVFPLALEFSTGTFGWRDHLLPTTSHHLAASVLQATYAWLMTFGCIGLFRSLLTRENSWIRYLSDSSYWMYLAHLPLVIAAQAVIRSWPGPALIKLTLLSVVLTGFLLLTYQTLVRYTWIGLFLNGKRTRQKRPAIPNPPSPVTLG